VWSAAIVRLCAPDRDPAGETVSQKAVDATVNTALAGKDTSRV